MSEFVDLFIQQLIATSLWEWTAVIFAIIYLLLAIKENIWCWPAALVSTSIYAILFFDVNLYMESLLNLYYLIMAVYGWYLWRYKKGGEKVKPVIKWSLKTHGLLIIAISGLILISGLFLENYTNQDFAYIDSFTTWFAVITTYMVAQKVLENWIYWIAINSVSVYLYIQKDFALTAVLFVSYIFLAVWGWQKWKQHYLEGQLHHR